MNVTGVISSANKKTTVVIVTPSELILQDKTIEEKWLNLALSIR